MDIQAQKDSLYWESAWSLYWLRFIGGGGGAEWEKGRRRKIG